jgi:hypothetical protein
MQPSLTISGIEGLTFERARLNVLDKLKVAIQKSQTNVAPYSIDHFFFLYLVPIFLLVVMIISTSFAYGMISTGGCVFTILFIAGFALINIWIHNRCRAAATHEVTQELQRLYDEYAHSASFARATANPTLSSQQQQSRQNSNTSSGQSEGINGTDMAAGYPQSSIVTCFRNRAWQRVPSLLLAEGDIIALQGGDITPGDCFELSSDLHVSTVDGAPSSPLFAPRGQKSSFLRVEIDREKVIPKGTKILIRVRDRKASRSPLPQRLSNSSLAQQQQRGGFSGLPGVVPPSPAGTDSPGRRNSFSSSSMPQTVPAPISPRDLNAGYQRHKSLAPDSLELLQLTGDMRCFQLAETPIEKFVSAIIEASEVKQETKVSTNSLFYAIWKKVREGNSLVLGRKDRRSAISVLFMYVCCFAVMLCAVLMVMQCCASLIRLSILREGRIMWVHVISFPLVSIVLSMLPLSLPGFLVFTDALSLANLLAVTEGVVQEEVGQAAHDKKHLQKKEDTKMDIATGGFDFQNAGLDTTTPFDQLNNNDDDDIEGGVEVPGRRKVRSREPSGHSSKDDYSNDEFLDEDIDVRVGDFERENPTRVHYGRRVVYCIACLLRRLGFSSSLLGYLRVNTDNILPIPFANKKLLEYLGGVTMVCFVDDDVVCEAVSATEEVFLLKSETENDASAATGSVRERSSEIELAGGKGVTIDLTSSTTAGSRFETSNWWKYLPNLKPIGLNSMLTYMPMPPFATGQDFVSFSTSTRDLRDRKRPSLETTDNAPGNSSGSGTGSFRKLSSTAAGSSQADMFVSLVSHVRKMIPLESLRQLSQDIGFTDEDFSYFQKLLELNVIAPGLGDARLLEDTHAMGQEEIRRRGMLMTNLRSAVVMDSRSKALQMMSQGDPALLLHYCGEYWDGTSISPLSDADRKEILAVYERWMLEDFDVTAFAYTPIPAYLQSAVLQAHELAQPIQVDQIPGTSQQNDQSMMLGLMTVGGGGTGSGTSVGMAQRRQQRRKQTNCIFIVDPFTETRKATIARTTVPLSKKSAKAALPAPAGSSSDEQTDAEGVPKQLEKVRDEEKEAVPADSSLETDSLGTY